MKASNLNRRITIQQRNDTRNASAGATIGWITVPGCASVPANFAYPPPSKKGDEIFAQGQQHSAVFVSFTIRYRPSVNLTAAMRIVYGTSPNQRIFNIRTIFVNDEARQWITIQAEEIYGKGTQHG